MAPEVESIMVWDAWQRAAGTGCWEILSHISAANRKKREWTGSELRLPVLKAHPQWRTSSSKALCPKGFLTSPNRATNRVFKSRGYGQHSSFKPPQPWNHKLRCFSCHYATAVDSKLIRHITWCTLLSASCPFHLKDARVLFGGYRRDHTGRMYPTLKLQRLICGWEQQREASLTVKSKEGSPQLYLIGP